MTMTAVDYRRLNPEDLWEFYVGMTETGEPHWGFWRDRQAAQRPVRRATWGEVCDIFAGLWKVRKWMPEPQDVKPLLGR